MLRSLITFFKDPMPTPHFDNILPGINIIEGIARVEEPLRSPVRGQNCIAFNYRAYLSISGSRSPVPAIHQLKHVEAYAAFELDMEGGTISVHPKKSKHFTSLEHLDLSRKYGANFQGIEDIILPGARVRLRGKAKKTPTGLVFYMTSISVIEKQVISAGVVGDRKKRRQNKK